MQTNSVNHSSKPNWLNTQEYPFKSHYFDTPNGRIHYVDEGTGIPILMVHGTPVWSYLYRNVIKKMAATHRCIALDHLGFGLSDKPANWAYKPEAHAANLEALVQHLGLTNFILMVHDFGGPIGLSYALNHPQNVQKIVLFNTWMWSLKADKELANNARIFNIAPIRWLLRVQNVSPKVLVKAAFHDKSKLTPELHQHYIQPFAKYKDRNATTQFMKELLGSSTWFNSLWEKRGRIAKHPCLVLWGKYDAFIREMHLKKWKKTLYNATFHELECGHFVQEEMKETEMAILHDFLMR